MAPAPHAFARGFVGPDHQQPVVRGQLPKASSSAGNLAQRVARHQQATDGVGVPAQPVAHGLALGGVGGRGQLTPGAMMSTARPGP